MYRGKNVRNYVMDSEFIPTILFTAGPIHKARTLLSTGRLTPAGIILATR